MAGSNEVSVISISSSEATNPSLDLYAILNILGVNFVSSLTWGIEGIDCTGPEAQPLCLSVDASPNRRLLISGPDLLQIAPKLMQVIEGVFVGYSSKTDANTFLETGWASMPFGASRAETIINVEDGQWFDVYLRSKARGEKLARSFNDVRWGDSVQFLT